MMRPLKTALVALALTGFAAPALADGDAAEGEKVYRKCKTCHQIGDGAENKLGPALNGIVGASAGAVAGFDYSKALMAKASEGLVWTEENLAAFLEKPKDFMPGSKMSFAGLRKEDDREDVIAYLKTFP